MDNENYNELEQRLRQHYTQQYGKDSSPSLLRGALFSRLNAQRTPVRYPSRLGGIRLPAAAVAVVGLLVGTGIMSLTFLRPTSSPPTNVISAVTQMAGVATPYTSTVPTVTHIPATGAPSPSPLTSDACTRNQKPDYCSFTTMQVKRTAADSDNIRALERTVTDERTVQQIYEAALALPIIPPNTIFMCSSDRGVVYTLVFSGKGNITQKIKLEPEGCQRVYIGESPETRRLDKPFLAQLAHAVGLNSVFD